MSKKQKLVESAKHLIKTDGILNITRARVCELAGVAPGSFHHYAGESFSDFLERVSLEPGALNAKPVDRAEIRRDQLLNAALRLAEIGTYREVTRRDLADAAGVSVSLVSYYFNNLETLRGEIVKHAVVQKHAPTIAQAVAYGALQSRSLTAELRQLVLNHFAGL